MSSKGILGRHPSTLVTPNSHTQVKAHGMEAGLVNIGHILTWRQGNLSFGVRQNKAQNNLLSYTDKLGFLNFAWTKFTTIFVQTVK